MIERYYFWMKITHSVPLRDHMPEVYSSPAGAAKVQCVWSKVPAAWWEWEGKAGIRPIGTCYSPAYSAQSLPPCLNLFVERLIKDPGALRGFTTSGSSGADEHGHPIMFPSGVRRGMCERTHPCGPACEQLWTNLWAWAHTNRCTSASVVRFCARLQTLGSGGWEFFEASECADGLQLWSVMRKVGSNWAALPVISDENHRIKGLCSPHRSVSLSACVSLLNLKRPWLTSAPSHPSENAENLSKALKALKLPSLLQWGRRSGLSVKRFKLPSLSTKMNPMQMQHCCSVADLWPRCLGTHFKKMFCLCCVDYAVFVMCRFLSGMSLTFAPTVPQLIRQIEDI